jgi:undecaprenyl-diphosphatase
VTRGRALPLASVVAVAAVPGLPAWAHVEQVDRAVLRAVVRRRPASSRRLSAVVTEVAAPPVVVAITSGTAAWAVHRAVAPSTVAGIAATAAAGIAARRALAEAVGRRRPPADWWWAQPSGHSYPSRHVTWAVLGFGAAADLLTASGAARPARAVRLAPVLLVAPTRLLLAVHWPSDVVAAVAFARAWRALAGR